MRGRAVPPRGAARHARPGRGGPPGRPRAASRLGAGSPPDPGERQADELRGVPEAARAELLRQGSVAIEPSAAGPIRLALADQVESGTEPIVALRVAAAEPGERR